MHAEDIRAIKLTKIITKLKAPPKEAQVLLRLQIGKPLLLVYLKSS